MSLPGSGFWILVLAAGVAAVAAVCDLRSRRIPNGLTIMAMVMGITIHTARSGWDGLTLSLWGMAIGGGALLLFCILGGMGAGDVKLMAGLGAMVGYPLVLFVLVLTGLAGGIMAMGKLIVGFGKSSGVRKGFKGPVIPTDAGSEGGLMKETIPYGVAIAAGTLVLPILVVILGGGP